MKKIYSKLTKERNEKFQIETAIYSDKNGKKMVSKRALNPSGAEHIEQIYKNSNQYNDQSDVILAPCEKKEDMIWFPYIQGISLYDKLLRALETHRTSELEEVIKEYKDLQHRLYPQTVPLVLTDKFREIFGDVQHPEQFQAAENVNVDLTLDNVILSEEKTVIIDYEWIFDFPIPIKFPIYRTVYALISKHFAQLSDLKKIDDLYMDFDISENDRIVFEKMNQNFNTYVEGGKTAYHEILKKYQKPLWDINFLLASNHYIQVFFNQGNGWSEENSRQYFIEGGRKKVSLIIGKEQLENCKELRIDPLECSVVIRVNRFEAETPFYTTKISENNFISNARCMQNIWIFYGKDPQILLKIPQNERWESILLEYEILFTNTDDLIFLTDCYEKKYQKAVQKLRTENLEVAGKSRQEVEKMELTIQLLKDKLAYIEGTTVYRKLLKHKVDAIGLWKELEG